MTSLQLVILKIETCKEKKSRGGTRFGARSVKIDCVLIKNVQTPSLISHTYACSLSLHSVKVRQVLFPRRSCVAVCRGRKWGWMLELILGCIVTTAGDKSVKITE